MRLPSPAIVTTITRSATLEVSERQNVTARLEG